MELNERLKRHCEAISNILTEAKDSEKKGKPEDEKELTYEEKYHTLPEERMRVSEERAELPQGFIERCGNLVNYFQPDSDDTLEAFLENSNQIQYNFVFDHYSGSFGVSPLYEEDYKDLPYMNPQMWEMIFQEAQWIPYKIAFAIGFCLGQLFDLTDPDIQAHVEAIKGVIREKGLLPYLPRERGTET